MASRSYSDEDLASAVEASRSWRGALRHLGLAATSSSAIRSVRHRARFLGLDDSHFTGQRRWTDDDLRTAVAGASSWVGVAEGLGLSGGSSASGLKGHAARLGLDVGHLSRARLAAERLETSAPDLAHLPRAGSMLAAAWFTLCGDDVSWPLEPCPYDLVVRRRGELIRVQVKTTRFRAGGTWLVRLSTGGRHRGPYDPDDIDFFFVLDGDLAAYLIPVALVGGLSAIHLSAYGDYRLPSVWQPPSADGAGVR